MTGELVVLLGGVVVGVVRRDKDARLTFAYDATWRESPTAYPLSLSMPLGQPEHVHEIVYPWLSNLLPDSALVLERLGRRFQVSPRDVFGLLENVGEDCAGAVQFCRQERLRELQSVDAGQVEWLSEADLADRVRAVRADPAAIRQPDDIGYFTLSGAQAKLALFREGDRWGIPSGRWPTNVIIKPPPVGEYDAFEINEYLCLKLARAVGLKTAEAEVVRFEDQAMIAVERYDRVQVGDAWVRVHQEDFCQVLGVPPELKYENRGGPGTEACLSAIQRFSTGDPTSRGSDDLRFVRALALNWAIAGTDAHAKNYSLLLTERQVRLAPIYDVASALPYPKEIPLRKAKLAMRVGREYHVWKAERRNWDRLSRELGTRRAPGALAAVRRLVERVPDAWVSVCAAARADGLAQGSPMVDEMERRGTEFARECLRRLEQRAVDANLLEDSDHG